MQEMFMNFTNIARFVINDFTGQSALKSSELLKNGLLSFEKFTGIVGVYNVACTHFGLAQYYLML